jgi:NAD(P)-dependent dehydrogenase (short-subunit alcohol dehydrogenase family)
MDEWTVDDVPDQSGRVAIVTGANSGLGFETASALAGAGAHVVLACRDTATGSAAAGEIRDRHPEASLAVRELDLASLAAVRGFAERVRADVDGGIDLLVNNAGVMAIPRSETEDGFETQFGVNHLGHFALTGLLLDALRDAGTVVRPARVVTVSSGAHRAGEIDFDDLDGEASYGRWSAYAASKLANLLFAFELQRRLAAADAPVASLAAHPGWAATNLQRRGPEADGSRVRLAIMRVANALLGQDPAAGAAPQLYAATAPDAEGGAYYGPSGPLEMRGPPTRVEASEAARDEATARRLWGVSERRTGVAYDLPVPDAVATPRPRGPVSRLRDVLPI